MKLDTFFDNFSLLADASNGVQKLREMVLQLAVQGKLVPQDLKDEPASILLERIKAEKERLIKEKKTKKPKPLPPINPDEMPYKLPVGWEWVRLGQISEVLMGNSPPGNTYNDSGDGVPLINGPVEFSNGDFGRTIKSKFTTKPTKLCKEGDLLICVRGSTTGRTNIADFDACIGRGVAAIQTHIFQEYSNWFMVHVRELVFSLGTGSTFPSISYDKLVGLVCPLPPYVEQKRIVAKIDELMALCDELEVRKQQVSKNCIQLNDASIHKLLTVREPTKFKIHWQRICENFDLLYSKPENVNKIRQAILQLAVQGKLVPQDPKDEPASILLEKIMAEKERLIKEKKIKKAKPLPPLEAYEIQYQLLNGWEWTQLSAIGLINPRNEIDDETEVSFVPMKLVPTILGDRVESEIRQWGDIKKGFTHFSEGDVALAKITPCFQNKKSTVMRGLKNGSGAGTTELHIFRPINDLIISEYVLLYLKTPNFIREGVFKMTGSAGQKRVPKTYFSETPFPLPPTNEQKRIVAKVDELMDLCDELEASILKSQTDCDRLMEAAVAEILAA